MRDEHGVLEPRHRIDRRDPKLRVAPRGLSEELEFGSAIGLA